MSRIKKKNPDRTGCKAFTLIEVVIAATIFAIIAASIGASLFAGIKIWDRAKNVDLTRANALIDMERIMRELYQTADIPDIGFEGTSQKISFATVSGNSILKIIYEFSPTDKTLYKSTIDLKDIIADKSNKDKTYPREKAMALDDFAVTYYSYDAAAKKYADSNEWKKGQGVFQLVEFRLKIKDEEIDKKVFIPIAQ